MVGSCGVTNVSDFFEFIGSMLSIIRKRAAGNCGCGRQVRMGDGMAVPRKVVAQID
jgi:hypothetical protein